MVGRIDETRHEGSSPDRSSRAQERHRESQYVPSGDAAEFRRTVGIVRRRFWVIVTTFVIVATLGTVYVFKATPIYEATAKILIEQKGPRLMNFEEVVQMDNSDRDYYKTQEELVLSRASLEKALEAAGVREMVEGRGEVGGGSIIGEIRRTISAVLGAEPAKPAEPWEKVREMVKAEWIRGTHLIEVRAESEDAERAAQVASAVALSFEAYHRENKLETSNEAFRFLKGQKAEQEAELVEAEEALQAFREEAQEVSLDVSDKGNPVLVRLGSLSGQVTEVQLKRIELDAQRKVVKEAVESGDGGLLLENASLFALPAVRADGAITELRAKLLTEQKELATLSTISSESRSASAGSCLRKDNCI